eukprot:CAMPEP_0174854792 /NCGR_PEP_ID=MMETSP1114-20130205/31952_1 /TAXON_ID=312471 /ORGANISM="Neobodo designis, Strain CCAP 1951/1" /LENGTH=380 /DNA_ID=CAMNT_0016089503 /DNA_START=32 /DNA_END=1174 /DNA_ORIENTATION=-
MAATDGGVASASPAVTPKVNIVKALMARYGTPHSNAIAATGTAAEVPAGSPFPFALTRKTIQALLAAGAVRVNGAEVLDAEGVFVDPASDDIQMCADAYQRVAARCRVWAYHKPAGIECVVQERDPASIAHVLKRQAALFAAEGGSNADAVTKGVFPVGRLDKDSCGLLLLTTSGALCERLLHPSFSHEKEYVVTVNHSDPLPPRFFELMRTGVTWRPSGKDRGEVSSAPCTVEPCPNPLSVAEVDEGPPSKSHRGETNDGNSNGAAVANSGSTLYEQRNLRWAQKGASFRIVLTQGLNRQIRFMTESAGRIVDAEQRARGEPGMPAQLRVVRLQRVRIGPVHLEGALAEGSIAELTGSWAHALMEWAFAPPSAAKANDV